MQYCYFNGKEAVFINTDKQDRFQKEMMKTNEYSPTLNALSLYLNQKRGMVTMKQIQSRFKKIKHTCAEWGVMCAFAGISLQGTNNLPSKWYVAI